MQETKSKTISYTMLTVLVMGGLLWMTFRNRTVNVDSGSRMTMGTFARIVAVAQTHRQAEKAIAAAFEAIEAVDDTMSDYDPDSLLSEVNRDAYEHPVQVDADLFEVLTAAKLYSCASDGAFDVTIGPVVQLWRKANEDGVAPTPEALAKAKQAVDYEGLILDKDNRTVKFANEGMFIDLGGIAKGYAIDQAVEALQAAGLKGGMVDIGGDLRCFGVPAGGKPHWLVGLKDPQTPQDYNTIIMKLNMDDKAIATSGDYQRFVMIGNEKHSHIINPDTADSAQDVSSVTVIAPTAMAADALATAVTVLGAEDGLLLIESLDDCEAFTLQSEGKRLQQTSHANHYIQE